MSIIRTLNSIIERGMDEAQWSKVQDLPPINWSAIPNLDLHFDVTDDDFHLKCQLN